MSVRNPAEYDEAIRILTKLKIGDPQHPYGCNLCEDEGHSPDGCRFNPLYAQRLCRAVADAAHSLHEEIHGDHLSLDAKMERMHEFLHYCEGCVMHMGEAIGPSVVVPVGEVLKLRNEAEEARQ